VETRYVQISIELTNLLKAKFKWEIQIQKASDQKWLKYEQLKVGSFLDLDFVSTCCQIHSTIIKKT
jgi:hypothetical protein